MSVMAISMLKGWDPVHKSLISLHFSFSILVSNLGKLPLFISHLSEVMITLLEMAVKGSNIISVWKLIVEFGDWHFC